MQTLALSTYAAAAQTQISHNDHEKKSEEKKPKGNTYDEFTTKSREITFRLKFRPKLQQKQKISHSSRRL